MAEIWKPVVGFEGVYEVSNFGKVRRRRDAGELLKNLASEYGVSVSLISAVCTRKGLYYSYA